MICPLCGSNLELKQINFSSAIFICMDLKCPYPVGSECIKVKRNYQNINETPKYTMNQPRTDLQKESSSHAKENTNDIEDLFSENNIMQLFETTNLQSAEVFEDNQANINQSIESINPSQNMDLSNLDDLDNFICELLK